MRTEPELLNERLERLAIVLDEIMPRAANLVRDALELLEERPELIRCKDCKYFHEFEPSEICKRIFHDETNYECWNPRLTDQDNVPTKGPNWFCADGERGEQDALDNSKC